MGVGPPGKEHDRMKLTQNESTLDRIVRIIAGAVLAGIAIAGAVAAPWSYALWVVAAILLVTGAVGFCPLYAIARVNTRSTGH
jgi:hypothetical protein